MEDISFLSYFLIRKAPVLVLTLAGIVLAIIRWKRHPKVSLVTVIGLSFFTIESLIYSIVLYRLPRVLNQFVSYTSYDFIYTLLFVLDDIAYALVILLLVIAALIQRSVQTPSKA